MGGAPNSSPRNGSAVAPKCRTMTKRDIEKSRAALMEILTGIVEHADEQAKDRCPYRNRHDHCTAKFRCRNQVRAEGEDGAELCGHDGPFDYRLAWETQPRLYDKAKTDIEKARDRRRTNTAGIRIFDLADRRGLRLATSCGRSGTCHECVVEIRDGAEALSPRSPEEAFLQEPFRLACQAELVEPDAEVDFVPLHRRAKILTDTARRGVPLRPAVTRRNGGIYHAGERIADDRGGLLGLAVDLGTTTIAMEMVDLETGADVAACSLQNPQLFGGSDIMNRITYDRANQGELQKAVVSALNREIAAMARRGGVLARKIAEIVVVGNSTMRDVLFGLDVQGLGQKPYRSSIEKDFREGLRPGTALLQEARDLGLRAARHTRIYGLPLIGSHVGADTAAALAALDIRAEADEISMLVDIGTNTEIVLAGRGRMLAASCPAGPAFEGGLVTCGIPGHEGAIERIRLNDAGEVTDYHTIGDKPPVGLCGSALVDLLAELRRTELISRKGVMKRGRRDAVMDLLPAHGLTFSPQDASHLAQAKAASYCGQALLLHQFGITAAEISTLYLAGGFANYLDIENAIAIGLLAPVDPTRVVKAGNAALQGARELLLDATRRPGLEALVRRIEHVELETAPEFFDLFVEGCQFKPMPADLGLRGKP